MLNHFFTIKTLCCSFDAFLERLGDALFTGCENLALRCLIIFKVSDFYESGTKMSGTEF